MYQISKLKELSFLVYGLGLSGQSVIKFFRKNKIKNFKVWDDNQKNLFKYYRTKDLNKTLKQVDYIILAPGISLIKKKNLNKFKKKIISDLDIFYLAYDELKSIVVTGTNGKSTTCKLLAHLLKKNGYNFILGGNIGTPILDLKFSKNKFVIIEASSFQLSHSKFICPNYAFFLNLKNDHLDWHGNMRNYLNSKLKIFKNQTQKHYAIINSKFKKTYKRKNFLAKTIVPQIKNYEKIKHRIKNKYLEYNLNNENMSFVYTFAKLLKISEISFVKTMRSFKGLPHRFEIFLKKNNLIFINDSKATSFTSSKLALSSLNNVYWILGGLPKKGDKINLLNYKKNILKCYLIGKNINFFKKKIEGKIAFTITKNLKNTVIKILQDCNRQSYNNISILLSPAAASFDQFKNFEERGKEFKRLCKLYARKYI